MRHLNMFVRIKELAFLFKDIKGENRKISLCVIVLSHDNINILIVYCFPKGSHMYIRIFSNITYIKLIKKLFLCVNCI